MREDLRRCICSWSIMRCDAGWHSLANDAIYPPPLRSAPELCVKRCPTFPEFRALHAHQPPYYAKWVYLGMKKVARLKSFAHLRICAREARFVFCFKIAEIKTNLIIWSIPSTFGLYAFLFNSKEIVPKLFAIPGASRLPKKWDFMIYKHV